MLIIHNISGNINVVKNIIILNQWMRYMTITMTEKIKNIRRIMMVDWLDWIKKKLKKNDLIHFILHLFLLYLYEPYNFVFI